MKRTLYCDVDGVIYNWDLAANMLLGEYTKKSLTYPSYHWDSLEMEAGPEAWKWLWKQVETNLLTLGPPIVGSLEGLEALSKDWTIHLVSHRPSRGEDKTREWLKKHDVRFDFLTLTQGGKKSDYVKMPPDFFVDDKPKNIIDAKEGWGLKNYQVALFSQAHNADFSSSCRVFGWPSLLERLS